VFPFARDAHPRDLGCNSVEDPLCLSPDGVEILTA